MLPLLPMDPYVRVVLEPRERPFTLRAIRRSMGMITMDGHPQHGQQAYSQEKVEERPSDEGVEDDDSDDDDGAYSTSTTNEPTDVAHHEYDT